MRACPLCTAANDCQAGAGCWCSRVEIAPEIRAFLQDAGLKGCLCQNCLKKFSGVTIDQARQVLGKSEELDSYTEDGNTVFTEAFHTRRGACCGSGCRHCPYSLRS